MGLYRLRNVDMPELLQSINKFLLFSTKMTFLLAFAGLSMLLILITD